MIYRLCRNVVASFWNDGIVAAAERHSTFYHLGRAIFEAVSHFGEDMKSKDIVLHGLSQLTTCNSLCLSFNAPIQVLTSTAEKVSLGMYHVAMASSFAFLLQSCSFELKYVTRARLH